MTDRIDWDLLDRYLAGEATPEEAVHVARVLEAEPRLGEYLDTLRRRMGQRPIPTSDWETDAAWLRVARQAGAEPASRAPLRLAPTAPRRRWTRSVAAAAVAALFAGGWWLASTHSRFSVTRSPILREYVTARGERAETRLPDGTRVVLGAASTLRVPKDYGDGQRAVYLDGEGYFEVEHDATRPFAVHARHTVARDLGTRFSVRAYAGESDVRVVVSEGEVALGNVTLAVGDLGRVEPTGAVHVQSDVDLDHYLGWIEGKLRFRNARLGDLLPDLARWYDLELQLAVPALAQRRLTLTVGNESATQMLDAVALLAHARYERDGRRVTLYPISSPGRIR